MFARALVAFLVLPGVFAIALPLAWLRASGRTALVHPCGLLLLAVGFVALLLCVRDFHVSGKGTLAPWSPPKHLVVVGLYRYSRNPMYVAVTVMLVGWAVSFGSRGLLLYAAAVFAAFHARVVRAEEPFLSHVHGDEWERYKSRVPRWLGWT